MPHPVLARSTCDEAIQSFGVKCKKEKCQIIALGAFPFWGLSLKQSPPTSPLPAGGDRLMRFALRRLGYNRGAPKP
jgi:hypothetical protein